MTRIRSAYKTDRGRMLQGTFEEFLNSKYMKEYTGKVQLVLTSPPFPLNRKKKYGNLTGGAYIEWLASLAKPIRRLLKPDGSVVMEIGNAWEAGVPAMSPLTMKALLAFLEEGELYLCQQFVWNNPAKLPTPAPWVNIERIRVKDSFTHIWWMSATPKPKADNRKILTEYSDSMKSLLSKKKYNAGKRPSGHSIGSTSFLKHNSGAIPSNVLSVSNTRSSSKYKQYCDQHGYSLHPARMPEEVAAFFIKFMTSPRNLVVDPFAGSNTTGATAEYLKRRWLSIEPMEEYIKGSRGCFVK